MRSTLLRRSRRALTISSRTSTRSDAVRWTPASRQWRRELRRRETRAGLASVMHIERVDERDSSWEDSSPRFRVYFFKRGHPEYGSYATDTYDIADADVLDVLRWA